ncbi:signal recognition particle-docking protein FtsY [Candidatus Pacearchaeota archaeon]|nr:signal recognition particle-docking protein FtsY [Candidatus Pacearchaeota archaeon]
MSWVGKDKEKPKKVSVKKTKTPKKEKEDKKIKSSSRVPLTKEEKIQETEAEQIIQEASTSLEQQIPEPAQNKEKDEEKGNFFTKLLKKISTAKLTEGQFDECFEDLEITLLENNVALEAVDAIRTSLKKDLVDQQIKKTEAAARIMGALKEAILSLLTEPPNIVDKIKSHEPYIILFFGINGTGKTTSVAKLAYFLKKQGISVVLAAADTFRAASIEQLKTHSEKIGVPMISSSYGADPASVAFESISYAKKNKTQVVLIDTAGRMYTKDNLLKEMEKIVRISKPNLKLFVGESITGNDAIDQARTFNDTIGIDGVILSKADIDEKAGTILSVSHVTHKPIYFLGTGQKYQDLTLFTKKTVLKNLGLEQ